MRKKFKIFVALLLIPLAFLAVLLLLSKVFEKQIVNRALSEFNKTLVSPVKVNHISFSLIRNFPQATLRLDDVVILSPESFNKNDFPANEADTLLSIKSLFLSFNVVSLLNNRLELKQINVQDARGHFLVDKQGKDNFLLWKKSSSTESSSMVTRLKKIVLENCWIQLDNKFKKNYVIVYSSKLYANGELSPNQQTWNTAGNIYIQQFGFDQWKLSPPKPARLEVSVNYSNNQLTINKGGFRTSGIRFDTRGKISFGAPVTCDLKLSGNDIQIESLLEFLPPTYKKEIENYTGSGVLQFNSSLKGIWSNTESPAFSAEFNLASGTLSDIKENIKISNIELKGAVSNGALRKASSGQLAISNFSFETQNSRFAGTFNLTNFLTPIIKLNSSFSAELAEWKSLSSDNSLEKFEGKVSGTIQLSGPIRANNQTHRPDFSGVNFRGNLKTGNLSFKQAQNPLDITDLDAELQFENTKIHLSELKGKLLGTKFDCSAEITSSENWLSLKNPNIYVGGNFFFDQINQKQIDTLFSSDSDTSSSYNLTIHGPVRINGYVDDALRATNIYGMLDYSDLQTQISELTFNTMKGRVFSDVLYLPKSENSYVIQTRSSVNGIDISELFATYRNFDQSFITDKNLRGLLTADFTLEMTFRNDSVLFPTIELLGHAKIINGQLVHFEPMEKLAVFSEIDEFRDIRFSTLENDIMIDRGVVHIPSMDLESNAFDISLFGQHSFDGDYEYHLKLLLSDILRGKARRTKNLESSFGPVEDDGVGKTAIFLKAMGTGNETKISLDGKEMRTHLKSEMKAQKTELKKALNEEFGLFKKDTLPEKKKPQKKEFEIEWDDN